MQGVSLIRFVVGVIGNVVSGCLFLSPAPTFWRIWKKKSTEEFHPYPYLAAMMNCMLWIFYGLPSVHPDSVLVISINSFGLFMEIIYLIMFLFYSASKPKYRRHIVYIFTGELLFLAAVVAITFKCFHSHSARSMFTGILCDFFGIIMYASPLSNMFKVIKTKSTEYMPFWLCVVGFTNGLIWFAYAFLKTIDPYIATGNGIGAVFGSVQLAMFAYYTVKYPSEKDSDSDEKKPSEVQLPPVC